mgnify:CR=1 FL=1
MKMSIIVCVFNERDTLATVLELIQKVDFGVGWTKEVLVVDNCSTDGTRELLQSGSWANTEIILNPRNLGKSGSIRAAISRLSGDYAVIQDADLEYHPDQLPLLLRKAQRDGAVAVLGSRVLGGSPQYIYFHAFLGVRLLTALTNLLYGSRLTDVATAIKMVRSDVLKSLHLAGNNFELDFELVNKLLLAGHTVHEVALKYHPRSYSLGKKIRSLDGLRALMVIVRDRLGWSPVFRQG